MALALWVNISLKEPFAEGAGQRAVWGLETRGSSHLACPASVLHLFSLLLPSLPPVARGSVGTPSHTWCISMEVPPSRRSPWGHRSECHTGRTKEWEDRHGGFKERFPVRVEHQPWGFHLHSLGVRGLEYNFRHVDGIFWKNSDVLQALSPDSKTVERDKKKYPQNAMLKGITQIHQIQSPHCAEEEFAQHPIVWK